MSQCEPLRVEPFTVATGSAVLSDLHDRIHRTRWPDKAPGAVWKQGTDLGYLQALLVYWADGFDWRVEERWLNYFDHFRTMIDDVRIHFLHHRAAHGQGIPLVLTHG